MKYYFTLTSLLFYSICFSQENSSRPYPRMSLSAQSGVSAMSSLPKNIDEQLSFGSGLHFHYNIPMGSKKPFYLTTGLGYERYRFISDGHFAQGSEGYSFVPTPDNYKQHEDDMQFLRVPLMFRFVPFQESATSIGFYGNYLLKGKSKYKIGADKFTMEAPIQNKFQYGIAFDQEFVLLKENKKKIAPVLGFGFSYQLSKFLDDQKSFKPFSAYFKVGFALW